MFSNLEQAAVQEMDDHAGRVISDYKGLCSTHRSTGITQQNSVGPCCETHLDQCPQELYQLRHPRELVTEYLALDLQNRKSERSAQPNV